MMWILLVAAAFAEPVSEGWIRISGPDELASLPSEGWTPVEGRVVDPGGDVWQRVMGRPSALDALRATVSVRIERRDHRRGPPPAGYSDPEQTDLLQRLVDDHDRAGYAEIGRSVQQRALPAVWLGVDPAAGAPTLRVLGGHHGDEASSAEVAYAVALELLAGPLPPWLDDATLWIAPWVNVDGYLNGSRYNAHTVDLNRNYDFEWSAASFGAGGAPFSEPETRAVRAHGHFHRPYASLSLHSGATNIGYVWNYTTTPSPDEATLEAHANVYADHCTTDGFWVTNGAAWYTTRGDTNDWSYGRYGVPDYTVEVSLSKTPAEGDIAVVVDEHVDAVLGFLAEPPTLRGRVVDARTGIPLDARVQPLSADAKPLGAAFYTAATSGEFARILQSAPAELEVSAPGWLTDTVPADTAVIQLQQGPRSAGRPSPTVLSEGSGLFTLPRVYTGTVALHRSGAETVKLASVDGIVSVVGLDPGPWTVSLDDGTAWPNALLAESSEGTFATWRGSDGVTTEVRVADVAPGAVAYGLWGGVRTLTPLASSVDGDTVVITLPITSEPIDLVIHSGASVLAISDEDMGNGAAADEVLVLNPVGCLSTGHRGSGALSVLIAAAAIWARRRDPFT